MKTAFNVLLLSMLPFLPCSCELPKENTVWSVLSWNVQNLFDGVADGGEYPEFNPELGEWDQRLYDRRLDRVGEVCSAAGEGSPDLCVFQELEHPGILDDLADGPLKHAGYRYRLAVPGFGIIRCGILSRYPIRSVKAVDCGRWGERSLRPALSFLVETPAGAARVIAVHWKSPRDGRAATESTRCREAAAVLELALSAFETEPGIPLLVIGDMNTPGDGAIRPAALAPWEPEADSSQAVLFRTPNAEGAGLRDGIPVFFDPDPDSSRGSPGSYWYREAWDRPDRALLSESFVDAAGLEFRSCRAGGTGIMEDSMGRPEPWNTAWEEGYSDHLPLILEFSNVSEN